VNAGGVRLLLFQILAVDVKGVVAAG